MQDRPGFYRGRHYTDYGIQVVSFINRGQFAQAEDLLLHLVDAVEAENQIDQIGVAPWYYKQLAQVYHTRGDYDAEIRILERCVQQKNTDAPGVVRRLRYARSLLQMA
ncbi:MAG: tetratricopeptide repeat protein [Chloroflexota bacterium]